MYLWQYRGAFGLDLPPTPEQVKAQDAAKARAAMNARAERLKDLPEDVRAERAARMASRARRRARQRSDPEWREEVKRNRENRPEPDASKVLQGVDPEGDIIIVR